MAQRRSRHRLQVMARDAVPAVERGAGAGGADEGELAAHAVGFQRKAQRGGVLQHGLRRFDCGKALAGAHDAPAHLRVGGAPGFDERLAIALEGVAPLRHLHPGRHVARGAHLQRQAEAVKQLRAQFALFGVAGADEDEAGRVAHAQALALHHVLAGGGDVKQQVDEVVLQQVHLVDVEETPVGARQQARLEPLLAARQRAFQIERADDAVFRCAERQVHHGDRNGVALERRLAGGAAAVVAGVAEVFRIAVVGAALHRLHLRQELGERAHGGGLAGAAVAEHQHAPNRRIDRRDQKGKLHVVLADDGGKRKGGWHARLTLENVKRPIARPRARREVGLIACRRRAGGQAFGAADGIVLLPAPCPVLRLATGRSRLGTAGCSVAQSERETMTMSERAILAGGCFWGMQDLIRKRSGVITTRVGYTGGENANPTYRNHPGHAEAIEIVFDPARISYRDLLEFFFQIHDPTTPNRQGNDIGSSYRSEIFTLSDAQRAEALAAIADVDASGLWPGKVVTKVSPAREFWAAEPEHQDYLVRYPHGYTCHYPRPNWKLPRRQNTAA